LDPHTQPQQPLYLMVTITGRGNVQTGKASSMYLAIVQPDQHSSPTN
jgi:hypothetical protein